MRTSAFAVLRDGYLRRAGAPRAATALLVALGMGACDSAGPQGTATVRVLLTDAPSDYIESAEVWISRVYLQGGTDPDDSDDDGVQDGEDDDVPGRVDLFNDPENPKQYDLLTLRDGVTADLTGEVAVEPGVYSQLRLVVDQAFVTLAGDHTFNDGGQTSTLFVPSGSRSGIKVKLSTTLDLDSGEEATVVVDFDVDKNFVLQGNPETPAGIHGVLFTPTLVQTGPAEPF